MNFLTLSKLGMMSVTNQLGLNGLMRIALSCISQKTQSIHGHSARKRVGIGRRYLVTAGGFQFVYSDLRFIIAFSKRKFGQLKSISLDKPMYELRFDKNVVFVTTLP